MGGKDVFLPLLLLIKFLNMFHQILISIFEKEPENIFSVSKDIFPVLFYRLVTFILPAYAEGQLRFLCAG